MKDLLLLLFSAVVAENFLLTGFSPDRLMLQSRSFRETLAAALFTVASTVPAAALSSILVAYLPTAWLAVLVGLLLTSVVTLLVWLAADALFDTFATEILPLPAALSGLTAPAVVLVAMFRPLGFPHSMFFAIGASVGVSIASALLQLAMARIRRSRVSRAMDGLPLVLVILAVLAMLVDAL